MNNQLTSIPNILTLIRIGLIPVFILAFYLPFSWSHTATAVIFALAAITDMLDGYLARKLGQVSDIGAFLDPVADKLMVAVALVLLVQAHPTPLLAIPAAIIVGREIAVSALREWMAELGKRTSVAVSIMGKFKTLGQMLAVLLLLYHEPIGGLPTATAGYVLLYVAAVMTLWSMAIYLRAAWKGLVSRGV
ncbi:MAG TPA: CDP-diacylglycerol--glycerol-3-phosphate 3-phosphatidyltransferase [Gammaproteobacteria bacterium]|nr:CDP-diacylglycerol--glycerol-3-phosphate 3-phosphatidyltransferase [Gammaproteobacteria bacterium]